MTPKLPTLTVYALHDDGGTWNQSQDVLKADVVHVKNTGLSRDDTQIINKLTHGKNQGDKEQQLEIFS